MSKLVPRVEVLRIVTVLQDCIDKMIVLGNIMPIIPKRPKSAESKKLKQSNAPSAEDIEKLDRDRLSATQIIVDLVEELENAGTFNALILAVNEEKQKKAQKRDFFIRREETRQKATALKNQLRDIHKEKMEGLQQRDEMIAHLTDQLQELKSKSEVQRKYVMDSSELLLYQENKIGTVKEKQLEDEIKELQFQMEQETQVHQRMESFLKRSQAELEEMLEMWVEKYERDLDDKQQELNKVKSDSRKNLQELQELSKQYRDNEEVIIEDRLHKETLRKKHEQEQKEFYSAVKIQAFWRGTMVRRCLGPYRVTKKKSKKEKGKKKKK